MRIGILGAARIAPLALINPARGNAEVVVAAVAARDVSRAQAFAAKHGIARVHDSYEALIADPELDAVYNPLPNGLHGRWTRAALGAGKHVLCEKPFTANAAEAREIAELAAKSDQVVMEAFHYRYHPLTLRVEQIIASGELGNLERVEAAMCFPLPKFSDIRYDYSLAGGATMDAGCYAVHMVRTFGGSTPEVVSARAKLREPRVDRAMTAELRFAGGHTGRVRCSMWSSDLLRVSAKVVGDRGELRVLNPVLPHIFHRLSVRSADGNRRVERFPRRTSYAYQLDAFAAAVLRGEPVKTTPEDAIENMAVIDAIYRAAGLAAPRAGLNANPLTVGDRSVGSSRALNGDPPPTMRSGEEVPYRRASRRRCGRRGPDSEGASRGPCRLRPRRLRWAFAARAMLPNWRTNGNSLAPVRNNVGESDLSSPSGSVNPADATTIWEICSAGMSRTSSRLSSTLADGTPRRSCILLDGL